MTKLIVDFNTLSKEELIDIMYHYDNYIQNANDNSLFSDDWKPMCIHEFWTNEYQEILEDTLKYNRIEMPIDEKYPCIAGYELGKAMYDMYIEPYADPSVTTIIVFPKHINTVSSSYVQGFMHAVGKDKFNEQFLIEGNNEFVNKFNERINF